MTPLLEHRLPIKTISLTLLLGLGVYLALVSVLTDWASVWRLVRGVSVGVWLQVVALALFSYGMRFLRWQRFMLDLGHHLPFCKHLTIYLSAFALTLIPAKAGELIRSFYLHPMGVPYKHSLASFVSERLIDLLVVALLASLSVVFLPAKSTWVCSVLILLLLTTLMLRFRVLDQLPLMLKGTLISYLISCFQVISQLLHWRSLAIVFALGVAAWVAQGSTLYLVANAMGNDLPLYTAISIYCFGILAGAISFIPGGLGAAEGAMILLLMTAGVDLSIAISSTVIARGFNLWLSIFLGIMSNFLIHRSSYWLK